MTSVGHLVEAAADTSRQVNLTHLHSTANIKILKGVHDFAIFLRHDRRDRGLLVDAKPLPRDHT